MTGIETQSGIRFLPIWNPVPIQQATDEGKLYWDLFVPGDSYPDRRFIISPMQNNKALLVVWTLNGQKEETALYNALCSSVEEAQLAAEEYSVLYIQAIQDMRRRW